MKNILLLSYDGECHINYDEEPEFKTIVNTWVQDCKPFPHECEGMFYSPTQRHGEVMHIQSKILFDLGLEYEYVASYCHDLKINVSDINKSFRLARRHKIDCFSPALLNSKNNSHKDFISKGDKLRTSHWVEIMAAGFSKRMYVRLCKHMNRLYGDINLVSGWGLDMFLMRHIIKYNKYKCRMLDMIKIEHLKKVTSGTKIWRNGLNSRTVMDIIKRYSIESEIRRKRRIDSLRKSLPYTPINYEQVQ